MTEMPENWEITDTTQKPHSPIKQLSKNQEFGLLVVWLFTVRKNGRGTVAYLLSEKKDSGTLQARLIKTYNKVYKF